MDQKLGSIPQWSSFWGPPYLFTLVAIDGVVAHQGEGPLGEKLADDESSQQASKRECRPRSGGEDTLIRGLVTLAEGAERSQEVGNGSSSGGEQGRGHEDGET